MRRAFFKDACSLACLLLAISTRHWTAESSDRTRPCFSGLLLPILRRCRGFERSYKCARNSSYVIDSGSEGLFIDSSRPVEAANFSDELQRSRADLCLGRRRFEIMQDFDVSTHIASRARQSITRYQVDLKSYR